MAASPPQHSPYECPLFSFAAELINTIQYNKDIHNALPAIKTTAHSGVINYAYVISAISGGDLCWRLIGGRAPKARVSRRRRRWGG